MAVTPLTREQYYALPAKIRGLARAIHDNPGKDARRMIALMLETNEEYELLEAAMDYLEKGGK